MEGAEAQRVPPSQERLRLDGPARRRSAEAPKRVPVPPRAPHAGNTSTLSMVWAERSRPGVVLAKEPAWELWMSERQVR